ncbi:MAG: hypothetical protein ACPL25_05010 [Ignavibacteria bacterium]
MELKSKDNQDVVKMQIISWIISFVLFNAILQEADWLVASSVILLIVLIFIVRILGGRRGKKINLENQNFSRRMS